MRVRVRPLVLAVVLLLLPLGQGCRTPRLGRAVPAGAGRPIPPDVVAARRRLRAHDLGGCLERLSAEEGLDVGRPERSWLLAHVLAGSGGAARMRRAAERLPTSGFRTALIASLSEDPEWAWRTLTSAGAGGPHPWISISAAWLAELRGEHREAWGLALAARGRGWDYVDVESWLIEARAHLDEGRLERAVTAARRAARLEPTDTRARLIEAAAARRAGNTGAALDALVAASEQIPEHQGYVRGIANLLRRFRRPAWAARVAARLEGRLDPGVSAEHLALAGLLAERRGEAPLAIDRYERALGRGAIAVPVDRDLRRLHFEAGHYARGMVLLLRATPAWIRTDPENLLHPCWLRLTQAARRAPDASAPAAARWELGRALVKVGALREAGAVLDGLGTPAATALSARVAGHLALEDALEAMLEGGFQSGHRKKAPPRLEQALGELACLAAEHLTPEEAALFRPPWRGLRQVPIVGGWLDHSVETSSGIVQHFRHYGRFLMLGQRGDQPTEAIVLSLASLVASKEIRTRGRVLHHDVAIGYDRRLGSWLEATGAELGGACLPDGIWIDADSARASELALRSGLALDPARTRSVRDAPRLLPPDGPGGLFGLTDPSGVGVRLLERHLAARRGDPWGSFESLVAHEFGHVVEIKRHLPILRGLPASVALIVSRGFSPPLVEQELERRAQLAAVAESRVPALALSEMVAPLPILEKTPDVHAGGYAEGLRAFVIHVWQHPDLFPQIDRDHRILPQLDLLTDDQIRAAARAALCGR